MNQSQLTRIKAICEELTRLQQNESEVSKRSVTGADADNNHDALLEAVSALETIVYSE
jgi:hypothetical protein